MNKRFQDLDTITENDIQAVFQRNDSAELVLVSVSIALISPDLDIAQDACIRLCSHSSPLVKGNALVSLGHLARRFRQLDELRVKPIIEEALEDTNEYICSSAQSAADEIHQFLGWTFKGHEYARDAGV